MTEENMRFRYVGDFEKLRKFTLGLHRDGLWKTFPEYHVFLPPCDALLEYNPRRQTVEFKLVGRSGVDFYLSVVKMLKLEADRAGLKHVAVRRKRKSLNSAVAPKAVGCNVKGRNSRIDR